MNDGKPLYIGIDGGGTTTELLAASEDETTRLLLEGPSTNIQIMGIPEAAGRIANLIQEARDACGPSHLKGVCAGLAGAGRAAEQQEVAAALIDRLALDARGVSVVTDVDIAVEAAFNGQSGVAVIAGTGSHVCGRTRSGTFAYTGGWGRVLGDEGSGYAIGRGGLQAVAAAVDGGPATMLVEYAEELFGEASKGELVRRVYREEWPLQKFAPYVLKATEQGDEEARRIVHEETQALVQQVQWLVKKNNDSFRHRMALSGGLTGSSIYRHALAEAVQEMLPGWKIEQAAHRPVVGAWRMAARNGV